jgi:hypothetical protein
MTNRTERKDNDCLHFKPLSSVFDGHFNWFQSFYPFEDLLNMNLTARHCCHNQIKTRSLARTKMHHQGVNVQARWHITSNVQKKQALYETRVFWSSCTPTQLSDFHQSEGQVSVCQTHLPQCLCSYKGRVSICLHATPVMYHIGPRDHNLRDVSRQW